MRLLILGWIYPEYVRCFYAGRPGLDLQSYEEQKAAFRRDAFPGIGVWREPLEPFGYDVMDVSANVRELQTAWARENGISCNGANWMQDVALAQAKAFRPDIVFASYNRSMGREWMRTLRRECPSVRLVLGFMCAPFSDASVFDAYDVVLTCTDEYRDQFRQIGHRSEVIRHAFTDEVLPHLAGVDQRDIPFSFVGQVFRSPGYHLGRERLLEQLVDKTGVQLFCPQADMTAGRDALITGLKTGAYAVMRALKTAGMNSGRLSRLPVIGPASRWDSKPLRQINPRLKSHMKPGVYGLDMFRILKRSRITFNSHGDTVKLAANVRMYEATGVGACLLTDWKPNLPELFEPDREVVAYRSPEECVEKARWLLDHPRESLEIGERGQKRTLAEHTYQHRAALFDSIIRREMAS